MISLGVSTEGVNILSSKSISAAFAIEGISSWEANIIKQHLLSFGSDCALNRAALVKNIKTSIVVFGNVTQLRKLCDKLKNQPFRLKEVSRQLSENLDNIYKKEFIWHTRRTLVKIKKPLICGILNITPDSFSQDGLLKTAQLGSPTFKDLLLRKVEEMVTEGAAMIDIGGESSRPYSLPISETQEIQRIVSALSVIRKEFKDILISVDTYKYNVAAAALEEGADIINDITALRKSPKIASLLKKYRLGCILMHTKGMPKDMQRAVRYADVVGEIIDFFEERLTFCVAQGIAAQQLVIDPGIGFGKRVADNCAIIAQLYKFKKFGLPIFMGISRKSFIGKIIDADVNDRLMGTLAATIVAVTGGASIVRVHDVKETSQALKVLSAITREH
jgi:dihydropteroate synthase